MAITGPTAGSHVSGNVTVTADASDNVGVTRVNLYLDSVGGTPLGSATAAPYSITWDANTASAGSHMLLATATDAAGNTGTSTGIPVTVDALTLPQVAITSPLDGSPVARKSTVTIQASVTVGSNPIARVDFLAGSSVVCTVTTAPYRCDWVVPPSANKTYQLRANAVDQNGNVGASNPVTVTAR